MSEIIDPLVMEWATRTATVKAEIRNQAREYSRVGLGERVIRTLWPAAPATLAEMRADLDTLPERLASVTVALRQAGLACGDVYEIAERIGAAKIILPGHDYVITVKIRTEQDIDRGGSAVRVIASEARDILYRHSTHSPGEAVSITRAEALVPATVAAVLAPEIDSDDDED